MERPKSGNFKLAEHSQPPKFEYQQDRFRCPSHDHSQNVVKLGSSKVLPNHVYERALSPAQRSETQNPCCRFHFSLHPGNHGLSSSVCGAQPFSIMPFSTCSFSYSSNVGIITCSTCHVFLYVMMFSLPCFSTFRMMLGT